MIDDAELREEWYQEMLDEAKAEEIHEYRMRNDYDNFLEYYYEEVGNLIEALNELKNLHDQYGWEFDIREFEGL